MIAILNNLERDENKAAQKVVFDYLNATYGKRI